MKIYKFMGLLYILFMMLGCTPNNGLRIDNIPMYGQPKIERPPFLKKADDDFIKKVSIEFGSRKESSKIWYYQAEKFMDQGNLDYAMRRYNQSWLLDPNNYQPYWGFGRIMLEKNKIDDAIKYLEKAEIMIDDSYQKVALLTDLGTAYTYKGTFDKNYFSKANKKFAKSIDMDPTYTNAIRRWAYSLYEQGNYIKAWEKVQEAEKLNTKPFPKKFIFELESKLSRPN